MTDAAAVTSLVVVTAMAGLLGFTSGPTRVAVGTSSWSSPQFLGAQFGKEIVYAGRITARPGKAGDEPQFGRIVRNAEHDRDRRCCGLGRERCGDGSAADDYLHLSADEVGSQFRQSIGPALRPTVVDDYVLGLDVSGFCQILSKCRQGVRNRPWPSRAEKSDHSHSRLLCARSEGPASRRAADEGDELPAPHGLP
jgi:hypothetical protein